MKLTTLVAGLLLAGGAAATAQTLDDLKNDGKNTDNILTYGMGYGQNRYSPLKQIDKSTVKRLVPVWNLSLDNQWASRRSPLSTTA
jgi:alcohol dehydrogenase (cytochrome c)